MNRREFLKNINKTYRDGLELIKRKNTDYGTNSDPFQNFRNSEIVKVSLEKAILIRVIDKITRISNLLERQRIVKEEKITDTLLDSINYLAILKVYLENRKKS